MKTIFSLVMLFGLSAGAAVINVAEYGIVPGKDVSRAVNELVASLKGKKDVSLYFPKGRYEFRPERAIKKYRAVTNHDNSVKPLAFPIFDFEDFTLDGNGSTFLFYGKICPITVEGSKGVTLKNFSIDWDTPFHHELKVVDQDTRNNTFVAEISPLKHGFEIKDEQLILNHYDWQNTTGQNVAFDLNTQAPSYMTGKYSMSQNKKRGVARTLDENRVEMVGVTREAPPLGTVIVAYGPYPNRFAQAIHTSNSRDISIENVTVYAAGGMALIAERCENVSLNRFVVTSTANRVLSTRADATHFLGCKGLIKMENCLLEHMGDDGINVHGAYVKVVEVLDPDTLRCEMSHRQQVGLTFCEPGDRIMVTSRETILPLFEVTVKSVKVQDEAQMEITFSDMPDTWPKGPLSLENITWNPDVIMRNNIIRNNRARSALITTKGDVLIEDNFFSSQMHGILIEGDNKSWYESGGVRNVVINNNVFENIGYGKATGYPLYVAPMLLPEQYYGDDQYHWNVRFTNNRIKSFNGLLVHASSVKGLVISGNTIELSAAYPTGSELPAIDLNFCCDVTVERNTFTGFDWPIRLEQKCGTTNVKVTRNRGLK